MIIVAYTDDKLFLETTKLSIVPRENIINQRVELTRREGLELMERLATALLLQDRRRERGGIA